MGKKNGLEEVSLVEKGANTKGYPICRAVSC